MFWVLLFSQASVGETLATSSSHGNFLNAILSANIIVQATFVILLMMSIISWAFILQKWFLFKAVKRSNRSMESVFLEASSFEEIYQISRSHEESPLSKVFVSGYNELQKVSKISHSKESELDFGIDNIERSLVQSSREEVALLGQGLSFLATTGSSCPFIGLFGTVFGIMDSFGKIATTGSASLAVVAPGISEALIATGFGLFAAIPASVFYNAFQKQIQNIHLECQSFSTKFLNIAKRNFFQSSKIQPSIGKD